MATPSTCRCARRRRARTPGSSHSSTSGRRSGTSPSAARCARCGRGRSTAGRSRLCRASSRCRCGLACRMILFRGWAHRSWARPRSRPGRALSAGLPEAVGGDQLPEGPPICAAAQPVAVPTSLTLMMTASFPTPLRILYQIPGGGAEKHRFKTSLLGLLVTRASPWQAGPLVGQVRCVVTGSIWGGPGATW